MDANVVGFVLGVWGTVLSTALAIREFRKGPKLRAWATGNMVAAPQTVAIVTHFGGKKFINLSVVNRGDTPTTITGLSVSVFAGRLHRFRNQALHAWVFLSDGLISGQKLPYRVEAGAEWVGLIEQLDRITNRPKGAIVVVAFSVTHRDKPIRSRVRFSAPISSSELSSP
jgi:hypothetical protein